MPPQRNQRWKTTQECIVLVSGLLLLLFTTCTDEAHAEPIELKRTFSVPRATVGQRVTVTLTVSVGTIGAEPLRGFYLSEHVPQAVTPTNPSARLDGQTISCLQESTSVGAIVVDSGTIRWVLETPPTFAENLSVATQQQLILSYEIVAPGTSGDIRFPGASWVGMIPQQGTAGDMFGYETKAVTLAVDEAPATDGGPPVTDAGGGTGRSDANRPEPPGANTGTLNGGCSLGQIGALPTQQWPLFGGSIALSILWMFRVVRRRRAGNHPKVRCSRLAPWVAVALLLMGCREEPGRNGADSGPQDGPTSHDDRQQVGNYEMVINDGALQVLQLRFLRGRCLASLVISDKEQATESALVAFAKSLAAKIPLDGSKPATDDELVALIPVSDEIGNWKRDGTQQPSIVTTSAYDWIDGNGGPFEDNGFEAVAEQSYLDSQKGWSLELNLVYLTSSSGADKAFAEAQWDRGRAVPLP